MCNRFNEKPLRKILVQCSKYHSGRLKDVIYKPLLSTKVVSCNRDQAQVKQQFSSIPPVTFIFHRYTTYYFFYKLNSVTLVRKRTIPTERPPLASEVSANGR
jgi:hypothetical protein